MPRALLTIFLVSVMSPPVCLAADDWEPAFDKGMTLREQKKYDEALKVYDEILAKDQDNARAHQERGAVLASLNRYEDALLEENRALKLNPDSHLAHIYKGMLFYNKEKLADAHKEFTAAAKIKPDAVVAHMRLGAVLRQMNRLEDATLEYKKAIELKPDSVPSHVGLSDVYLRQGDLEKAVEEAEAAVKIEKTASSCNKLGSTYSMINRLDEAKELLTKAIELDPTLAPAYENLGRVLMLQGYYSEAKSLYEKAKSLKVLSSVMFGALSSLNDSSIKRIKVVSSTSDWSQEDGLFRPQVTIKVKNVCGKDLTGKGMQFRARFQNCRTKMQLTAQVSEKTEFKPDQTIEVKLEAKKGFSAEDVSNKSFVHCTVNGWVGSNSHFESQLLLETLMAKLPAKQSVD
ncbi:MAG: tetratricopeptide repeat protein [Cyanobacteria bacterium]|nr:tetratricopeptide repeat protein [Cyanobacteriota bacterium]